MASNRTTTKTIRISNDTAEYLKDKDCRIILESICKLIQKEELTLDDKGVHTENEGVHTLSKKDIATLKDIKQMAELSGSNLSEVLGSLQFKLTFNDLEITNGELAVYKSLWDKVSEDEEVAGLIGNLNSLCDEKGIALEDAYKQVLMTGGKIVYANVRDERIG